MQDGQYLITELIIPKQVGGSDTCAMTDDGEMSLLSYCSTKNIMVLGWIHTHPRQECFMSSVDLHTHCGYQMMLPEAIAIVMAPTDTKKKVGIFQLTDPPGLQTIASCKLKGFHPHDEPFAIYNNASHVTLSPPGGGYTASVTDLR
jgi:STAM-binding protein